MKKLATSLCLILLVVLAGAGESVALPMCQGNDESKWQNCEGTLMSGSGKVFWGEFKDGKFVGIHAETGNKYEGECKGGKLHGQGVYIYGPSSEGAGDKHVGEYRNGKRHGQGTYTHAEGDKYVGEFRNDKSSGQGTLTFVNGNKYVGQFRDDTYHGQGTYTFADGDNYVGEFRDGRYHGWGTYIYGLSSQWEGDKYMGEWRNNKKHGQGTYYHADGRVQEGIWENDKHLKP